MKSNLINRDSANHYRELLFGLTTQEVCFKIEFLYFYSNIKYDFETLLLYFTQIDYWPEDCSYEIMI